MWSRTIWLSKFVQYLLLAADVLKDWEIVAVVHWSPHAPYKRLDCHLVQYPK